MAVADPPIEQSPAQTVEAQTLTFINEIREKLGLAAIDSILPGQIHRASCPLANSIQQDLDPALSVLVSNERVFIHAKYGLEFDGPMEFDLSPDARAFIACFDNGGLPQFKSDSESEWIPSSKEIEQKEIEQWL